jgi:hypothetical protein
MLRDSGSDSDSDVSSKEVCAGVSGEPVSCKSGVKDFFIDVKKISPDLHR